MNKKGQKTAEKNVSISFRVLQAPESWSKYTTHKPIRWNVCTIRERWGRGRKLSFVPQSNFCHGTALLEINFFNQGGKGLYCPQPFYALLVPDFRWFVFHRVEAVASWVAAPETVGSASCTLMPHPENVNTIG